MEEGFGDITSGWSWVVSAGLSGRVSRPVTAAWAPRLSTCLTIPQAPAAQRTRAGEGARARRTRASGEDLCGAVVLSCAGERRSACCVLNEGAPAVQRASSVRAPPPTLTSLPGLLPAARGRTYGARTAQGRGRGGQALPHGRHGAPCRAVCCGRSSRCVAFLLGWWSLWPGKRRAAPDGGVADLLRCLLPLSPQARRRRRGMSCWRRPDSRPRRARGWEPACTSPTCSRSSHAC